MPALRVSASDIDALRYFMADEDGDLPALLARLRRQEPPTDSMLAGTALHKALENSQDGSLNEIECDGYRFAFDFDGELDLPAIREMKATAEYQIGDTIVTLVGKVDAIHGRRIDDHKFTSRYDGERFLGGYQWRIYLELFGADEFRWNVFEGRETQPQHYTISNFHKLTTHRYPGMGDDVRRELAAYVSFASLHLPERFTSDAEKASERPVQADRAPTAVDRPARTETPPASVSRAGKGASSLAFSHDPEKVRKAFDEAAKKATDRDGLNEAWTTIVEPIWDDIPEGHPDRSDLDKLYREHARRVDGEEGSEP